MTLNHRQYSGPCGLLGEAEVVAAVALVLAHNHPLPSGWLACGAAVVKTV